MRVHTPSAFQRHPCAYTSAATLVAGTPSSSCATCAARNVGATTRDGLPCSAATSMAVRSMVVFPLPAAPSTITSASADATAAAATVCPLSSPAAIAASVTSGCSDFRFGFVAVSWSRSAASAVSTLRLVRCATCSGVAAPGGSTEKQSETASSVARVMNSRNSAGVACTPASVVMRVTCSWSVCLVHAEDEAALRSSARDATSCTDSSSTATAGCEVRCSDVAGSYPASRSSCTHHCSSLRSTGFLPGRWCVHAMPCNRAVITRPSSSPGCAASHSASSRSRLRLICADRFDIIALNGSNSLISPLAGSRARPCLVRVCASCGCAAITAVPRPAA